MATITSAGIGSGLDVETLISRLVAVERTPISQLQQRTSGLKTQLSAYGKLQSALASLRDASAKLTRADTYGVVSASSSDPTTVSASAANGAPAGNYSVSVSQLATSQTLASSALSAGTGFGTGTLTIDFGRYSDDLSSFDADPSRTSLIIPVVTGEDALESVRDKINAMKAGIVASVVSDANGSRLVMRSTSTGAENAFRVSVSDDDGNNSDASGLSALAYDPTQGIANASRTLAAANAKASIDGIEVESATNVISGAVEGLSLTLSKLSAAGSSTTITVGQDKVALKKSVTDFVAAYNEVAKQLRDNTRYDAGSKTAGPLQGDSAAVAIQAQLRNLVGSSTTLGGSLTRFAEIGLDPGSDGQIKIDDSKVDAALLKSDELKSFFADLDEVEPGNSGMAQRLRDLTDQMLSTDGRIDARQKGLQDRIDANADREAQLEQRLTLVEKRLRAQYTALDGRMSTLSGLSSYLTQQLQKL